MSRLGDARRALVGVLDTLELQPGGGRVIGNQRHLSEYGHGRAWTEVVGVSLRPTGDQFGAVRARIAVMVSAQALPLGTLHDITDHLMSPEPSVGVTVNPAESPLTSAVLQLESLSDGLVNHRLLTTAAGVIDVPETLIEAAVTSVARLEDGTVQGANFGVVSFAVEVSLRDDY